MTKFRERAAEVKAAGEAVRGNFEPSGVPLKVYKFWAENGGSEPERENFCHFWRVVVIWAPLLFVFTKAEAAYKQMWVKIVCAAVLLLVLIALSLSFHSFAITMGVVLGLTAGFALLVVTTWFGVRLVERKGWGRVVEKIVLGFLGVVVVGLIVFSLVGLALEVARWAPFALIGALAALFGMMFGLFWLGERRTAKRRAERTARYDYYYEHGVFPDGTAPGTSREPGRMSKFFHGLGDFLILIGQVIRVNKWKICPIVTIK